MGLEALFRGWVSRQQPQATSDNQPGVQRLGRYGEAYGIPLIRKQHALADEGSYFVANNLGNGVATAAAPTAFSDTAPLLTIFNSDSPTNLDAKRIHLDWLRVFETAAGTAGVDLRIRIVLDNINKYSSGGTALTPLNPNMDVGASMSISSIRLLPVALAQSGAARTIVGSQTVIPTMTAPLAVNSEAMINFGGVENLFTGVFAAAGPTRVSSCMPPIVIGPGQFCFIEFLITSQSAASSWSAELGFWER